MGSKKSEDFFSTGSTVEVTFEEESFKGSWYTATIIGASTTAGNHFWVKYDLLKDDDNNGKSAQERVHVSNMRPLPPLHMTNHKYMLYLNDVVEAFHRDGWWTGVIVKVIDNGGGAARWMKFLVAFESSGEELVFRFNELRLHVDWIDGKWVRPKKEVRGSSKKIKNAITDSEGSKSSKKLKKENAAHAPPVLTPCEFNSVSTKESNGEADCFSLSTEKRDINLNCTLESLDRHKQPETSLSSMKNLDCSEANNGKSNQSTKTRRQKKNPPQRFIPSLQGDKATVEVEVMHDKGIVHAAASEAEPSEALGNLSADTQNEPYVEVPVVIEMDYGTHELETAIIKQVCPETRSEQGNVTTSPAVITGTSSTSEKSHSWPFIKRSGVWKAVDSMDIFTRMPQTPHFSPLNEYKENLREKFALCLMMKFAYEVDRISRLSPDDLKNTSIVNEILGCLKELECNGFNVKDLKFKLQESDLREKLGEIKSTIKKRETEKTAAESEIIELVEQKKSLEEKLELTKMMKSLKERELAKLESAKGIVSGKIQSLELEFQKLTSLW